MKSVDLDAAAEAAETRLAPARRAALIQAARARVSAGRRQSESVTLACAVSLAVILGVACGMWITSLASAASVSRARPIQPPPPIQEEARHASAPPGATEPRPGNSADATRDGDEPQPLTEPVERPVAEAPRTRPAVATGARGEGSHAEAEPTETSERIVGAPEAEKKAASRRGVASPCALYASASSLTVRSGGATSLVLGGPGEAGGVSVTTPDWSNIAVFSEGRAGGKGWVRYSVRSVSKRAGTYRVRFTTPCGTQTIPVTVTRQ